MCACVGGGAGGIGVVGAWRREAGRTREEWGVRKGSKRSAV